MDVWFNGIVSAAVREAPRRYAHWDAGVFTASALPAIRRMGGLLKGEEPAHRRLLEGYVAALVEGVGLGYIPMPPEAGKPWPNLLCYLLLNIGAWALPRSKRPMEALVEVWNLGEGLLAEPTWLNRYVVARAGGLWHFDGLQGWLQEVLEPVVMPPPPPRWVGPFQVTCLDLGDTDDMFLPGAMHLAAPSVVCVQHREDPDTFVSILLRRQGQSHVIGETPDLGRYEGELAAAEVRPEVDAVQIGAERVAVGLLGGVPEALVAASGFVVLSATDSQFLWVVEST